MNRRTLLSNLVALGLASTAVTFVMADKGMAQTTGPG